MSVRHDLDPTQRLCIVTARGDLEPAAMAEGLQALSRDPGLEPGWSILYDLRGMRFVDMDARGMRRAVAKDRAFDHLVVGSRVALVADEDVTFGLARMWASMSEERPLTAKVCRDLSDGLAFLGCEDFRTDA